jgi:hypothetical protein
VSTSTIIAITVGFIVAVAAYVVLSLSGVDTGNLGPFLVLLISNALTAVAGYVKSHKIEQKIDTVVEHTNGPISETVERIKNIEVHMNDERTT